MGKSIKGTKIEKNLNGRKRWGGVSQLLDVALLSAVLGQSVICPAEPAKTKMKSVSFDHDYRWDAMNNRAVPNNPPTVNQDFGYSKTNYAGKTRGEIGGEVWQSVQSAYYGKVIETRTLEDPLSASGSVTVLKAQAATGWQTTANIYVGWFNADEKDLIWRPRNFVGFRLQSCNEPDGTFWVFDGQKQVWQSPKDKQTGKETHYIRGKT